MPPTSTYPARQGRGSSSSSVTTVPCSSSWSSPPASSRELPMPSEWADATRYARGGLVCTVDHLASSAGVAALRAGGSAADAAVAASAVLAVTTQHMCGMGGDLLALVHPGGGRDVRALLAVGRAGSGSDADRLRAEGHARMPFRGDLRTVTVPGCVDGWLALHATYGRLPLST